METKNKASTPEMAREEETTATITAAIEAAMWIYAKSVEDACKVYKIAKQDAARVFTNAMHDTLETLQGEKGENIDVVAEFVEEIKNAKFEHLKAVRRAVEQCVGSLTSATRAYYVNVERAGAGWMVYKVE